jgi:tripartite-type tricarboxylate transporter receptor subunit TctC
MHHGRLAQEKKLDAGVFVFRRVFGAVIAWLTGVAAAAAQDDAANFPKMPVHIVVPFAAAGATDIGARIIGQKLSEEWGKPVIIENKPGATGAIAAEYVANQFLPRNIRLSLQSSLIAGNLPIGKLGQRIGSDNAYYQK